MDFASFQATQNWNVGRTLNMTPRSGSREVDSALYGEKAEDHVATTVCLAGE